MDLAIHKQLTEALRIRVHSRSFAVTTFLSRT